MPDEPTQTPPPDEKPVEENPTPSNPSEPSTPSTEETPPAPPETPTETPPSSEEPPKTPEPQPENPPQSPQQPQSPKTEEPKPEEVKPPEEKQPVEPELPKEKEPEKPKEEVHIITQEDVDKQIAEKLKEEQDQRRVLANEARTKKKEDNLNKILEFSKEKKVITNNDARDFLHVSQSTATNYLSELVKSGKLKREGQRGGTKYSA